MSSHRDQLLDWVEQGQLAPERLDAALRLAGVHPTTAQWVRFLDRLMLWTSVVLFAAAVVFFFAYNWDALGRYAKFALVQVPLLAAILAAWHLGPERTGGKAALLLAAFLVGALLALVGQTYQTGADTFELFAVWALAILPWALAGRLPALWLFWLLLVNTATALYWETFRGAFGILFSPDNLFWTLFALNTAALVLWEGFALRLKWLNERWAIRIVAVASGTLATILALMAIFEFRHQGAGGVLAWCAWMVAAYAVYRRRIFDLFVLAGGVLSAVVVLTSFLVETLFKHSHENAGTFLLVGLLIIGMSGAGAWWLRNVAAEHKS